MNEEINNEKEIGMKYPVIIYHAEEGGYVAEVPSLKGCLSQGETIKECIDELETVIELWLDTANKFYSRNHN